VKKGWDRKRLGDVCELLCRGSSPKYLDRGGVCVLNQKCIRDHTVSYDKARRHDDTEKAVKPERFVRLGDVLVNSTGTGTLGRVAQLREEPCEPTTVDSHVTIVRPVEGMFHREFFGYMLVVIEKEIQEAGEGCGGQTELARTKLAEQFFVQYPTDHKEQKRIVRILDEAFEGIEKAKANAEKNRQNAQDFFESHLNEVFRKRGDGGEEKTLGDICGFVRGPFGGSLKKSSFVADGYAVYEQRHAIYNQFDDVRYFVDEGKFGEMERFELLPNDLIMSCSGTMGRVAVVPHGIRRGIINQALLKLTPSSAVSSMFLKLWMESGSFQDALRAYSGGAAIQNVASVKVLKSIVIPLPSAIEQETVVSGLQEMAKETEDLESIYQQKLGEMEALKKSLLNQAFSGEL